MAVLLTLQMLTLSTEMLRNLHRLTQLGSGRAGIWIPASCLQGFAPDDLPYSLTYCSALPVRLFLEVT